jgi:hypothetical protein
MNAFDSAAAVPNLCVLSYPGRYERRLRLGMTKSVWLRDVIHEQFASQIDNHIDNLLHRRENYDLEIKPVRDVVALMPFYAADEGVGHSAVTLRRRYLNATFWSLYRIFPNIVISVCEKSDLDYVREIRLPVYDIFYAPLPDPRKLGVATLLRINRALNGNVNAAGSTYSHALGWDRFSFVYYTESDQILRVRNLHFWLSLASHYNNIVVPHRAAPVPRFRDFYNGPSEIRSNASSFWKKEAPLTRDELNTWSRNSLSIISDPTKDRCCFPTRDHACRNKHHLQSNASQLHLFQFSSSKSSPDPSASSFAIVAGEGNFWKMRFRRCDFQHSKDNLTNGQGSCDALLR